jgi:hypothetical protein
MNGFIIYDMFVKAYQWDLSYPWDTTGAIGRLRIGAKKSGPIGKLRIGAQKVQGMPLYFLNYLFLAFWMNIFV